MFFYRKRYDKAMEEIEELNKKNKSLIQDIETFKIKNKELDNNLLEMSYKFNNDKNKLFKKIETLENEKSELNITVSELENKVLNLEKNKKEILKPIENKITFNEVLSEALKNGTISDFKIRKIDFLKEREIQDYFEAVEELESRGVNITYDLEEKLENSDEKIVEPEDKKDDVFIEEDEFDISKLEENLIIKALKKTNGNKQEASKLLKIGRTTLYEKIRKYNIQ